MNEPKLRFKADDGSQFPDWEEKRLEEIVGKISSGKDKACNGNYVLYGSTGIIGTCQSPTYKGRKILVARVGANAGTVNLVNDDCGVSDNTLIINNMDLCNFDWLYFYMVHKELGKMRFGSGQPLITGTMLRDLCIQLPNDFEQQKIAEFLSTIDTVIEKQKETVSAWEERKKGVMQKLFGQEVRFKADDGSEFPEWEEKKLGDICKTFSGGTPKSGEARYYENGTISFIRSGEIHDDKTELRITNDGLNESSAKMVDVGDILYALYGATSGEVDISKIKGAINQAILCIRPLNDFNRKFIVEILRHNKETILRTYLQGGQGNLSAQIIQSLVFDFPCLAEQQKIANCLSSLDEVIEKQKATLAAWEELKKGLLQQMFV